jgi:serine/threonine protein kinase
MEVFQGAVSLPAPERDSYARRECGDDATLLAEVLALLQHHETESGALEHPKGAAGQVRRAAAEVAAMLETPKTVGAYHILSLLGTGAYGTVWLAERREPIRQRVALKILKPGMDSGQVIARFEQERQTLALLEHPFIARVIDAGATESGHPFFAMEYVNGDPINIYCDRHRLSIRDRLDLFIKVCEAVQHAHTKGIIHRDLKPTNILVESVGGSHVPKLIDFGIAKVLLQPLTDRTLVTETGVRIGTLAYMPPEQAIGAIKDIDTRSDVYALGVVLYQLLTGRLPFEPKNLESAARAEAERIIREVDPPRPSTSVEIPQGDGGASISLPPAERQRLSRVLRRELEWIPLKALRKERERRYETATDLARDVRNFLEGKPLAAGPESGMYRARKYVRRHWVGVSVCGTILIATAAVLASVDRARRSSARVAFVESQLANQQLGFASIPNAVGTDLTGRQPESISAVELVESAYTALQRDPTLPLETRARSLTLLSRNFVALGRPIPGIDCARQASELMLRQFGESSAEHLRAQANEGRILIDSLPSLARKRKKSNVDPPNFLPSDDDVKSRAVGLARSAVDAAVKRRRGAGLVDELRADLAYILNNAGLPIEALTALAPFKSRLSASPETDDDVVAAARLEHLIASTLSADQGVVSMELALVDRSLSIARGAQSEYLNDRFNDLARRLGKGADALLVAEHADHAARLALGADAPVAVSARLYLLYLQSSDPVLVASDAYFNESRELVGLLEPVGLARVNDLLLAYDRLAIALSNRNPAQTEEAFHVREFQIEAARRAGMLAAFLSPVAHFVSGLDDRNRHDEAVELLRDFRASIRASQGDTSNEFAQAALYEANSLSACTPPRDREAVALCRESIRYLAMQSPHYPEYEAFFHVRLAGLIVSSARDESADELDRAEALLRLSHTNRTSGAFRMVTQIAEGLCRSAAFTDRIERWSELSKLK